jgi:predicted cobalt transporter CbtA
MLGVRAFVNDSAINWRVVARTVGGCWLTFVLMWLLLGEQLAVFLNPVPLFVKAIAGILVYGYVGGNIAAIFVYWTLVGLVLSWLFHKFDDKSSVVMVFALLHLVVSALMLIPMMFLNGR